MTKPTAAAQFALTVALLILTQPQQVVRKGRKPRNRLFSPA